MGTLTRHLAAASLLLGCGCSLLLVHAAPPPPVERDADPACTRSALGPTADLALGLAVTAAGIATLAESGRTSCPPGGAWCMGLSGIDRGVGTALLTVGVAELVSGGVGARKVASCRKLLDAQRACRAGDDVACAALLPAPPPVRPGPPSP